MQGRTGALRWCAAARAAAARLTAALLFLGTAAAASAAELTPFEASFTVEWKGMTAGTARLALKRNDAQHWLYTSENNARGIFKVAVPGTIRQSSELRIEDGHIVPQHFRTDDGSEKSKRDTDVTFDWKANRATGMAEGKPVDVALQPGLQDSLSIQIALIHELAAGRTPSGFVMLDREEVKDYLYTAEGKERVKTAIGEHDTVIYASRRPDSDRKTLFWCAPDLGYLPVKVERRKGSKVEWSMTIATLKRE